MLLVDPRGLLGHIAGGALIGCGVPGGWSVAQSLISGDSFCACSCKGIISCGFGALGGALAAAAPTYAGCIYGIVSGLTSGAVKQYCKVACGEGNANVTCAMSTALITGAVGCIISHAAGASPEPLQKLEQLMWNIASRIVGHDLAAMCGEVFPDDPLFPAVPPPIGTACCTFSSWGTIFSRSVELRPGEVETAACNREAQGYLWDWDVVGARNGRCG